MYTLATRPAANGIPAQPSSGTAHIHRLFSIACVRNCMISVLNVAMLAVCSRMHRSLTKGARAAVTAAAHVSKLRGCWSVCLNGVAQGPAAVSHFSTSKVVRRDSVSNSQVSSHFHVHTPLACCLLPLLLTAAASRLCCSTCRPEASPRRCSSTCQATAQHSC